MATNAETGGRVLFASVSHPGIFLPMASIVAEFAARGDRVWFGSTLDRKAAVEAIPGDVVFTELGPDRPDILPVNWKPDVVRRINSRSRLRGFAAFVEQGEPPDAHFTNYERTLEAIDRIRPTLMVIDAATVWALDAALTRGVPYVLSSPMFVGYLYPNQLSWWSNPWPYSAHPPRMSLPQRVMNVGFVLGQLGVLLRPRLVKRFSAAMRERKRRGLHNPKALLWTYANSAEQVIGHSRFGVEHPLPSPPGNLTMLGPMMPATTGDRAGYEPLFDWLDDGEPVVYIGLGTTSQPDEAQRRAIVDAARRIGPGHRVLWSLREEFQALLPDDLPASLRVESWVPQNQVLAHPNVRVFLSHGGNGGHHGLFHGKPLLCFPITWEARDGAARYVAAGAALTIHDSRRPDGAEIAAHLLRLSTEPSFAARAEYWAGEFRRAGGAPAAADLIAGLAGPSPRG